MSQLFKRLLGVILLITTVGIATCHSLLKADPVFKAATIIER